MEAHFIRKKIVAGPRVNASSQNKKITSSRLPNPTPNKGDAGSLTIIAYDTGPLVSVSRQTVRRRLKISPCIDYNPHGIPIAAQSRQGKAISFIKHSYAHRSYLAPQKTNSRRSHSPHCRRHSPRPPSPLSPRSPSPLSPRRNPAPLQPHRSLCDDGDEDSVTGMRMYVFPANLKTVIARIHRRRRPRPQRRAGRLKPRGDVDPAPPTITRTTTSFATVVSPA
jgi:hypothetical protein